MKKTLFIIISIVTLFSCLNDEDDDKKYYEVNIRLSNISQLDFQNIVVNTSTGDVSFENLKSGQKSEYKVFDKAYRYAFIELDIEGKTYTCQPIDYVGEKLLEKGNYTYQLDASDSGERYDKLNLTLIED